jgi:hypothetical protein
MNPSGSASSSKFEQYHSFLELTKPSSRCLIAAPPGPVQETARSGSDYLNRLRKRPVFLYYSVGRRSQARLAICSISVSRSLSR